MRKNGILENQSHGTGLGGRYIVKLKQSSFLFLSNNRLTKIRNCPRSTTGVSVIIIVHKYESNESIPGHRAAHKCRLTITNNQQQLDTYGHCWARRNQRRKQKQFQLKLSIKIKLEGVGAPRPVLNFIPIPCYDMARGIFGNETHDARKRQEVN